MDEFLDEPPLCYRGRIFGVQPNDIKKGFKIGEHLDFVTVTAEITFKGELMYYDKEQDTYELKLRYASNDSPLEDTLYYREICKSFPESILKNRANLLMPPRFYSLPTHEMVENGMAPSLDMVVNLDSQGINFSTLVNTNFLQNVPEITSEIRYMLDNVQKFADIKNNFTMPQ